MSQKKQSGFSVVEGIILVVVIAVLGFIGLRLYTTYYGKQNPSVSSSKQNSNTSSGSILSKANPTSAETNTYLDIKELGIKITVNSSITDVVYNTREPSVNGINVVNLSTQSLIDKGCGTDTLGIITASTTSPTYFNSQTPLPIDDKTLFKFGDTYYRYVRPQNLGCNVDQATIDMVEAKINALEQVFSTVQPDSNILTIKELGMKLPLSDSIKNLTYTYNNQDGINFLHFSTSSIIAADPTCNEAKDPLGTYTVYTTQQPNSGHELPGVLETHVNGYYIYYSHVQYACGFDDTNGTASMVSSAIAPLLTAVQNAQAQ